jgi:hypothetical protein
LHGTIHLSKRTLNSTLGMILLHYVFGLGEVLSSNPTQSHQKIIGHVFGLGKEIGLILGSRMQADS